MSTTYADLEAQEKSCNPRLLAMSIFIETLRAEGLRASNATDVQRMARQSVDASRLYFLEYPGPLTGPTSVPNGATNHQESESGVADHVQLRYPGKAPTVELGSMRGWAAGSLSRSPHLAKLMEGLDSDAPAETVVMPAAAQGKSETGNIDVEVNWSVGSVEMLDSIRKVVARELEGLEEKRAAAVRRADALTAERDRLAGQVNVLKLRARDLKVERDELARRVVKQDGTEVESIESKHADEDGWIDRCDPPARG